MTDHVYVYLKDGVYELDETLTFDSRDSGSNGYNVIYAAEAGAQPVISGGADISAGWEVHDPDNNIYKRTGIDWEFRQLYVGDGRGIRARQPSMTEEATKGPYYRAKNGEYPYVLNDEARPWVDRLIGTNAEMVVLRSWSQVRGRIDTVDAATGKVDFKFPESGFSYNHHGQGNSPFFLENDLSLLDAEGEWYLDTDEDTLYYKPRSGETINSTRIVAPRLETVVNLEGSPGDKVRHIVFSGIAFKHSNWLAPSSYGYVSVQAGFRYQSVTGGNNTEIRNTARYTPANALLELRHTSDIAIEHSTFMHGGSWGIMGYEDTENTLITWNTFAEMAGGGIAMGIVGDRWDDEEGEDPDYTLPNGQSRHDTITHNTIDNVGVDYGDMVGIGAMLPQHMTIANNEIRNLPYSGISIGWNWSDVDHGMTNNQVYGNYIHDGVRLIQDGGGIYTLGRMDGKSNIYYNYIKNMRQGPYAAWNHIMGVYLDGMTSYRMVERNVIDNTEHAFSGSAHDNIIRYNYYNVDFGSVNASSTAYGNIRVSGNNWPQEALDIIAAAGPGKPSLPAPKEPVNLALKKEVTALSHSMNPAFAVDGDPATRWAQEEGRTDPQWLTVDLGGVYAVASTSTMFELNSGYRYMIEYSTDGETWEMYADRMNAETTEQTSRDVRDVMARYMRITMTHGWGGSVYEFSVFAGEGGPAPEINSLILRNEAVFDKNPLRQSDIQVKLVLNGGSLNGIRLGGSELVPGQDYILFWDQVLLNKSYLATLPEGEHDLIFDFATGVDPVLKLEVIDDDGTVNVALGKPATASSQSREPALAVDGNTGTRWAQQEGIWNTEGWLMVDLQGVYSIKSITTMFELPRGYRYRIEYSMDGEVWEAYADRMAAETVQQTDKDQKDGEVAARYVRIKALYELGPSIFEFSVFGNLIGPSSEVVTASAAFDKRPSRQADIAVELELKGNALTGVKHRSLYLEPGSDYSVSGNEVTLHSPYLATLGEGGNRLAFEFSSGDNGYLDILVSDIGGGEIDVALGKLAVASSQSKDPQLAVDGNGATRWAQQEGLTVPQWLTVDLGAEYDITGVRTVFELNSGYTYRIEYSTNGIGWTTYADRTAAATTEQANEDRRDEAVTARYVRLNVTDSGGNGSSVYEFNVYAVKEASGADSEISPTSFVFDKNPEKRQDAVVDVTLGGNTLVGVSNGEAQLVAGEDYIFENGRLTIFQTYLASLATGSYSLAIRFSAGQDAVLALRVTETASNDGGSGPISPGPGPGINPGTNPGNDGGEENGVDEEDGGQNGTGEGGADGDAGSEAPSFTDVSGHWAEAALQKAARLGIVNGYTDGSFRPDATVSRAEFAVMIMNVLKPDGGTAELPFTDSGSIGGWARTAVAQAVQAGIIQGFEDGSFRPAAGVTRAQMAVIIARAAGMPAEAPAFTGFADDDGIPVWAKGAVLALKEAGIVQGRTGNRFAPAATMTRAEAVTIIVNGLEAAER